MSNTSVAISSIRYARKTIEFYKRAFRAEERFGPDGKGVMHAERLFPVAGDRCGKTRKRASGGCRVITAGSTNRPCIYLNDDLHGTIRYRE